MNNILYILIELDCQLLIQIVLSPSEQLSHLVEDPCHCFQILLTQTIHWFFRYKILLFLLSGRGLSSYELSVEKLEVGEDFGESILIRLGFEIDGEDDQARHGCESLLYNIT